MWIVDAISAIVGPTVGKFFEVIISSFFGIFILLWNFSPVALIIFVLVLYGLYKLSDKLGTLVLGFGAAYAAYHFGHPIIACIIIFAVFENLFSSSGKSSSESGNRQKKQIDATPKNPIPDGPDDSHPTVFSPCDGTVLSIGVEPGIRVDGSQVVLIIESADGLTEVHPPKPGTVSNVFVNEGQAVAVGDELFALDVAGKVN